MCRVPDGVPDVRRVQRVHDLLSDHYTTTDDMCAPKRNVIGRVVDVDRVVSCAECAEGFPVEADVLPVRWAVCRVHAVQRRGACPFWWRVNVSAVAMCTAV